MDNPIREACQNAWLQIIESLGLLRDQSVNGWHFIGVVTHSLRIVRGGHPCPSVEQFLRFLISGENEHARQIFVAVKCMMETMTNRGLPFGEVMESFVRLDDNLKCRGYDGPRPIPGFPVPTYSLVLWRLLKRVYFFQSSLRPVTLRNRMMTSSSLTRQYGFIFRCVMHGMNPRRKLLTLSPGMIRKFLLKLLRSNNKGSVKTMNYALSKIFDQRIQ